MIVENNNVKQFFEELLYFGVKNLYKYEGCCVLNKIKVLIQGVLKLSYSEFGA
jgi:hypothetical protein